MTSTDLPLGHEQLESELLASLQSHSALPFLFIGSGLSRRYLDLPTWDRLLRKFADLAGVDYDYHYADADGSLPAVASSIAEAFHDIWWKTAPFAQERDAFKGEVKTKDAALKVSISRFINEQDQLEPGRPAVDRKDLAEEVALLKRSTVDGVITTNYDTLAEQLFDSFTRYVGQGELLLSDAQFIGEIYKIHGSISSPNSLVLTAQDYEKFDARDKYLAAKLLTIFAEHPVLFMGYSFSDQNIRKIISDIATAVGPERLHDLGKRIYFIEWDESQTARSVLHTSTIPLGSEGVLPIQRVSSHSFAPIFRALGQLERPFPAQILRELKNYVYELVTHPDPKSDRQPVHVVPLDSAGASNLRVVFGVGAFTDADVSGLSALGWKAVSRNDLVDDLLGLRKSPFDPKEVLEFGLPEILRNGTAQHVPIQKYLAEAGHIDHEGNVIGGPFDANVTTIINRRPTMVRNNQIRFDRSFADSWKTLQDIAASDTRPYFKFDCLLTLAPERADLEEMRQYLATQWESDSLSSSERSYLVKAICHYDWLRYREA